MLSILMPSSTVRKERRANFAYLFTGLSLLLLIGPALNQLLPVSASSIIVSILLPGSLVIGIWSFVRSRLMFRIGLALSLAVTVLISAEILFGLAVLRLPAMVTMMVFLALSIWYAGRDVLFGGVIDWNRLVGAMCIYEMIGLLFALLFVCIAALSPASFPEGTLTQASPLWDFVYYSFVTMTTLGYGDISPTGAFARSLAYMEALIGQLYLAVLISSLVGSHVAARKSDSA